MSKKIIKQGFHQTFGPPGGDPSTKELRKGRSFLTFELEEKEDGRLAFSAQGETWNSRGTDITEGGQCVERVAGYVVPGDAGYAKAQRIAAVWKQWHLNDMKAGTVEQDDAIKVAEHGLAERLLREGKITRDRLCYEDGNVNGHALAHAAGYGSWYSLACDLLEKAGKLVVEIDGKSYKYGSAWLYRPLPKEVVEEIKGW